MIFPWSDWERACLMVELTNGGVRYVPERGKYRKWDGTLWADVEQNIVEMELYSSLLRAMSHMTSMETDPKTMNRMLGELRTAQQARRIRETLTLFRSMPAVEMRQTSFDANLDIVPCRNGTYDLVLHTLYPSFSWDLQSRYFDVYYDRTATYPHWERFLSSACNGDSVLAQYLQMVSGYLLAPGNPLEKMFLIYGRPQTGKTTFIETLQTLFGTFARRTTISTFTDRSPTRNALASLQGTRVAIVDENDGEESGHLSSALLKQVVSGERVEVRFLYHEFFEFDVTFKIMNATNYLPSFKVFDDALRRRLVVIPFENQIPEAQRDPGLKNCLRSELPGILNWAIEGWKLVESYGLHPPFELQRRLHEYSLNFNSIERFLKDTCIRVQGSEIGSTELYQVYRAYCKARGEGSPMKHKSFTIRMGEAGIARYRSGTGVRFIGLRLRDTYQLAEEWGVLPDDVHGGIQ